MSHQFENMTIFKNQTSFLFINIIECEGEGENEGEGEENDREEYFRIHINTHSVICRPD